MLGPFSDISASEAQELGLQGLEVYNLETEGNQIDHSDSASGGENNEHLNQSDSTADAAAGVEGNKVHHHDPEAESDHSDSESVAENNEQLNHSDSKAESDHSDSESVGENNEQLNHSDSKAESDHSDSESVGENNEQLSHSDSKAESDHSDSESVGENNEQLSHSNSNAESDHSDSAIKDEKVSKPYHYHAKIINVFIPNIVLHVTGLVILSVIVYLLQKYVFPESHSPYTNFDDSSYEPDCLDPKCGAKPDLI